MKDGWPLKLAAGLTVQVSHIVVSALGRHAQSLLVLARHFTAGLFR